MNHRMHAPLSTIDTTARKNRRRPRAWDSATVASAAISVVLLSVIGLSACGPQGGGSAGTNASMVARADVPEAAAKPPAPVAPVARYGVVREVEPVVKRGDTSGAGAVIGGVLGAVAGNQIGDGSGRRVATVAGAAGGAYIGNRVEKNRKQTIVGYRVQVEMPNGSLRSFQEPQLDGLRVGDKVRVESGRIQRG